MISCWVTACADDDVAAVRADALQVLDARKVDEMPRRREPKLHQGDEAVAAAERAGILAEIGEEADGFVDGFRTMVGERAWNHVLPPGRLRARPGLRPEARAAHLLIGPVAGRFWSLLQCSGNGACTSRRAWSTKRGACLHELRQRN